MLDAAAVRASTTADAHGIDRVATWTAIIAAVAVVALTWAARDAIAHTLDAGDLWVVAALTLAIATLVAALVTRYLVSPQVGRQVADIATVVEAAAAGDVGRRPPHLDEGGQIEIDRQRAGRHLQA